MAVSADHLALPDLLKQLLDRDTSLADQIRDRVDLFAANMIEVHRHRREVASTVRAWRRLSDQPGNPSQKRPLTRGMSASASLGRVFVLLVVPPPGGGLCLRIGIRHDGNLSGWRESNPRPRGPKPRALPSAPHPVGSGTGRSRTGGLWRFKPALYRLSYRPEGQAAEDERRLVLGAIVRRRGGRSKSKRLWQAADHE